MPKWYTVEELLEQAYHGEPRWSPWSYELLNAAIGEIQERDYISTTALTSPCPRSTVLERKENYVIDVDSLWRAFRGTMVHRVLEFAARPNSLAEARFFCDLDKDWEISCSPDLLTSDGQLWDFKNVKEVPRYDYPYPSHTKQVQYNRYIVNHMTRAEKDGAAIDEFPFDPRTMEFQHLVLMYMDLNGPKVLETMTSIDVPNKGNKGTHKKKISDVWSDDRVEETMFPEYAALEAALTQYPDWPDGLEEQWGGGKTWACPGYPWCPLRGGCLASRYPGSLVW